MTALDSALQTTIASMKAYVSGLSPEAKGAFQAGLHASHFEEALAAGDWDRAAVHAKALGKLAPPTRVMEVSAGSVRWAPSPVDMTGSLWADLPPDVRRSVLYGLTPVPGLLIGKLLFGLSWPAASAAGLLTAPLLFWAAVVIARHQAAQQTAGGHHPATLGPRG